MVRMTTTSEFHRYQLHKNKYIGPMLISLDYVQLKKKKIYIIFGIGEF